jgi:hypothetical protein
MACTKPNKPAWAAKPVYLSRKTDDALTGQRKS